MSKIRAVAIIAAIVFVLGSTTYGWMMLEEMKSNSAYQGIDGEEIGGLLGILIDYCGEVWFDILFVLVFFAASFAIVGIAIGVSYIVIEARRAKQRLSDIRTQFDDDVKRTVNRRP